MNKRITEGEPFPEARLATLVRGHHVPLATSHAVARLVGPIFCAMGIGMLTGPDAYQELARQFLGGHAFIYFSGVLILLAGLIVLNAHHLWTADWRVAVTLLGWVFALTGTFRLIAPQFVAHIGGALLLTPGFFTGAGIVFLALGSFFTFKGYAA